MRPLVHAAASRGFAYVARTRTPEMAIELLTHGDLTLTERAWLSGLELLTHGGLPAAEQMWELAGGSDYGVWLSNVGALCSLASFSVTNIFALRIFAMVGQVCGIMYCQTRLPHPLWNPTIWQAVFLCVNAAQLAKLLVDEGGTVALKPQESDLYERVFLPHGVTPRQFAMLLEGAEWRSVGRGATLFDGGMAAQGRPRLALVHSGAIVVKDGGTVITSIPNELESDVSSAGWIGDIDFLEAIASGEQQLVPPHWNDRVSVITTAPSRLLVWDGEQLRTKLDQADTELMARLQQVLIASLASKLCAVHHAAASHVPSLHDQQLVDLDGDGIADAALVDTMGDGRPDTIVEWTVPSEEIRGGGSSDGNAAGGRSYVEVLPVNDQMRDALLRGQQHAMGEYELAESDRKELPVNEDAA